MKIKKSVWLCALLVGMIQVAGMGAASAVNLTWDASGTTPAAPTDGSGTWSNADWSNGTGDSTLPTTDGAIIGNSNGAAGTITLTGTQTAATVTLNAAGSGNYTFSSGALISTGALTVNAGATFNDSLTSGSISFATANQTLTLAGGSGALGTMSGTSTTIAAASTIDVNASGTTYALGAPILNIGTTGTIGSLTSAASDGMVISGATPTSTTVTTSGALGVGTTGNGLLTLTGGTLESSAGAATELTAGRAEGANQVGRIILSSGTVNITSNSNSANRLEVLAINRGGSGGTTGGGEVDIAGATVNVLEIDGTPSPNPQSGGEVDLGGSLNGTGTTSGTALLNVSSGTLTTGNIYFAGSSAGNNQNGNTGGTNTFNLSGGSVFVGTTDPNTGVAGGLVISGLEVGAGDTSSNITNTINLSGGTLGALANWSSSMTMNLTTGGGGNVTFETDNGGLTFPNAATFTNGPTGTVVAENISLSGLLQGTGGLNETGSGTLTLSGANTYQGATVVTSGTLQAGIAQSGTTGAFGNNSAVSVHSGGTVDLHGNNETIGSLSDVSGSGGTVTNLAAGSTGTLTTGGLNTSTSFAGTIADGAGAGVVALTKVGTGTQTLSGANTFSGGTIVSAGVLAVNNASGSGTGSGIVTVNGGSLGGSGTIISSLVSGAAVTINSGGILAPSAAVPNGATKLTLSLQAGANLTLAAPALGTTPQLVFDIGSGTGTANGSDEVVITGGGLAVNGQQFGNFTFNAESGVQAGTYVLIDDSLGSGITGTPLASFGTFDGFTAEVETIPAGASGGDLDLVLSSAAVPEPSTWAFMLSGGLGLLLFALHRRRQVPA